MSFALAPDRRRWTAALWPLLALASLASFGPAEAGPPGKGPPGAPAPPEEHDRPLWRASIVYSERSKSVYSRLDADYDISAGGAPRNGTVRFSSEHVYPGGKAWTGGGTVAFQSLDRLWQDVGPDGVLLEDGGRLMALGLPVVHLVVQGGRRLVSGLDDLAVEVRADYPEANEAVIMAGSIATPESEARREKQLEELEQAGEKQAGEVLRTFGFKSRPGSEEVEKEAEARARELQKQFGVSDEEIEGKGTAPRSGKQVKRMAEEAGRTSEPVAKALGDARRFFGGGMEKTMKEFRGNVLWGSKTWIEGKTARTLSWTFTLVPPDEPRVLVEGPHCTCGADGTAEVTARSDSREVVFEKFEVRGAPAGTVRRNEGGKVARLVLGNAARSGGPVEAVAVYRQRGKTHRAPPHTVHLALVEKPKTKDNEKWGGKGGADFAFDDGVPGHVEFEVEGRAWLDGKDASKSLRWLTEAAYLRTDPLSGARTKLLADGLPPDNSAFGRKKIRAVLEERGCACRSEPKEVRVFYWANAENGPQGKGTPNWAFYYRQTKAWNGADFSVGDFECGVPARDRAGGYDWCHDRIYLHPRRPEKPCRMPTGTPPDRVNRYIDCFAQTIRHEAHHQKELKEWWGGRTPEPTGDEDPDGDLVPAAIEKKLGLGCRDEPPTTAEQAAAAWAVLKGKAFGHPANVPVPATQYSCALATSPLGPGRPFPDVIDSEVNAYYEGWKWQTGSADDEDWAWPGKNWPP